MHVLGHLARKLKLEELPKQEPLASAERARVEVGECVEREVGHGARVLQEDVDIVEDGVRLTHLLQVDEAAHADARGESVVALPLGDALQSAHTCTVDQAL